jgi:hypothetical protein
MGWVMPVLLKDIEDLSGLAMFKSVLIVPFRFCPAASMAVRRNQPYFEVLTNFMKTASYEELIDDIQAKLESMGIKADIFRSKIIHQFVVCMWTVKRRKKLLKYAENYEAVMVLGCEAAVQMVYDSVESADCKVFQGMRSEGIMTVNPSFQRPCNISLELSKLIPLVHRAEDPVPWSSL